MPRFRFRAQAALDLRMRELESAQRDLARAEQDRDAAAIRLAHAEEACADARGAAFDATRGGSTSTLLEWYRFWILRLDHERTACLTSLGTRDAAVARAAERCRHALRRCRALERFRDTARRRHDAAVAAQERKDIDELATRRFAAARARERTHA